MLFSYLLGAVAPVQSVASGIATLAMAVTLGLCLGAIPIRGVKLGISAVLFSALFFGQIGYSVNPAVLGFLRDFALIMFMYAIGLQVGPGFISSLRTEGFRLNMLAVAVLVLGAVLAGVLGGLAGRPSAPGLYSGAFTTTPGLAAAQEALGGLPAASSADKPNLAGLSGIAYTIAYPFGTLGPIVIIIALRRLFRINVSAEKAALAKAEEERRPPIDSLDFEVTQATHAGHPLRNHPLLRDRRIVLSRMLRDGTLSVPNAQTELRVGDVYRAVGPRDRLNELVAQLGRPSNADLGAATGDVQRMELVVTRTQVLRRSLRELDLSQRTGVTIGRIERAGIDLMPTASLRLAFADRVIAVGPQAGLKVVEAVLGNSPETLNRPQLVPIFLGMVLGVMVGSIPLFVPGLHTTLRIGLAGGPLLAAIILSQLRNIGSIVWYMPVAANQLFRDFGLAVFLACVGLQAGDHFLQNTIHGSGLALLLWGAVITLVPIFLVACFARIVLKMNFITLSGWVAGTMTSSPALVFAGESVESDTPAVAYAAVAPLATLVPILCAQMLAIRAL